MRAARISFCGKSSELKDRYKKIRILNIYIDEVVILYFELGSLYEAINEVEKMIKEKYLATDQSKQGTNQNYQ